MGTGISSGIGVACLLVDYMGSLNYLWPLDKVGFQEGGSKWNFNMGSNGGYTSKAVSLKIDEALLSNSNGYKETLRNNLIPQKIGLFEWRASKGRIPVKIELDKQGIDLDSLLCPTCNDVVETVDHAIFSCKVAREVWTGVHKWWNVAMPSNVNEENCFEAEGYNGIPSKLKKVWQAILWTTSYSIWKNRNQKLFQNEAWASAKVVSEVQVKTFEWIINRSRIHKVEWQQWLVNPINMGFPFRNNIDPG
ncbi:uncharacterized protein [Rutidosis leptorrhynchoides]|uniref:uncharacterized protein n=1 Tax=Rutidosis leptorrhynchoides TaxID=125765 RepID=UPI003A9A0541